MIPLMVDGNNKRVAICGGGEVSARKAAYFAEEAEVTVYSRSFCPAFDDMPVKKIRIELNADDASIPSIIRGAFLVIAATSDPDLNASIRARCLSEKILCNNATSPQGDVILPAQYRGDRFTISVSSLGASPAISRFLREYLQNTFPCLDQMIALEENLRHDLKEQHVPEHERREILNTLLHDPDIWATLPSGPDKARKRVQERYQI